MTACVIAGIASGIGAAVVVGLFVMTVILLLGGSD